MSRPGLWRLFVSLALSFILLQSTLAALRQSAVSSSQASTVLQNSLAAILGNSSVSDVTITGTARRIAGTDDETGSVTFQAVGASSKIALNLPSGARIETRSNTSSTLTGSWSGPDGVSHPLAFHNLAVDSGLFPLFTLSAITSSKNSVLSLVGQEIRNGQSVIHLSALQQFPSLSGDSAALMQGLSQLDIFLDASTNLPVSLSFKTHPDDNALLDIPIEIQFSDYRLVSGVQVPFHVQKLLNNVLVLDLAFQNVAFNSGISANTFSIQ